VLLELDYMNSVKRFHDGLRHDWIDGQDGIMSRGTKSQRRRRPKLGWHHK